MRAHTLKVGDVRCVHEECKKGKECTMWRRQCESSKPTVRWMRARRWVTWAEKLEKGHCRCDTQTFSESSKALKVSEVECAHEGCTRLTGGTHPAVCAAVAASSNPYAVEILTIHNQPCN